jgi:hypothetical protein
MKREFEREDDLGEASDSDNFRFPQMRIYYEEVDSYDYQEALD